MQNECESTVAPVIVSRLLDSMKPKQVICAHMEHGGGYYQAPTGCQQHSEWNHNAVGRLPQRDNRHIFCILSFFLQYVWNLCEYLASYYVEGWLTFPGQNDVESLRNLVKKFVLDPKCTKLNEFSSFGPVQKSRTCAGRGILLESFLFSFCFSAGSISGIFLNPNYAVLGIICA